MFEKVRDPHLYNVVLACWALLALGILWYRRMLEIPKDKPTAKLPVISLLIAFLLFLSTCVFVPIWLTKFLHYLETHGVGAFGQQELSKFPQLITLVVAGALLIGLTRIHSQELFTKIWGQKNDAKAACFGILKGFMYTLLTYPLVILLVEGVNLSLVWFGFQPYEEQVAIVELKKLTPFPLLFFSFGLAVVTVVPLVEELLFRGFLQNTCSGLFGIKAAIVITSILFASFHYSEEQGLANIGLLSGLFVYSFFMGIFYCKEASLWVTIGMHSCFNILSLIVTMFLFS